jgi:CubicO group peptidase (beta-lactamase class C family)
MSAISTRRVFMSLCGRAALGLPFLSLGACRSRDSAPAKSIAGGRWQSLIAYLEKEIPSLLQHAPATPGVSIALVSDATLLWSRGFGVKERTTNTPVDGDTVFEFASVSKTVFAYAVMKACDKGILDLDTPLTNYTSERYLADPRLDLITPRIVLSHTTGFQNWRSKSDPLKIQFTPGSRWKYSGEGYNYLQSVLTHLTGHVEPNDCKTYEDGLRVCASDFDTYMKTNLLVPFGMAASGYLYRAGMARPHDEKGRLIADRKSTPVDAARYGSAGNLHSTAKEYAKFLIAIIDPKPEDAFRLSAASLYEMLRPQVKITDTLSWGLGWAIERHPGMGDIISHSGDNPGFKTMTGASVRRRSAFIIVTNSDRGFDDVITPLLRSSPMREFLPVGV